MRLDGAVVLVTGASSGIGAATSVRLAAAGARLIITGRNAERLSEVAAATGATPLTADLTEPGAAELLVDKAMGVQGRIDVLVCNAGAGWAGPIAELAGPKASELVSLNLLAPVQLARLLAPAMTAQGAGTLVFVSSIAGATGVRHEAVYAATKAGLNNLAESLAYELRGTGVGVSLVLPGVVDTPFFRRRGRPYERRRPVPIPAEQVARAITTALSRDLEVVYVPGWLRFPAWLHGAAPQMFRALAVRFS